EIASSHCLPQGLGPRQLCDYSRDLPPTEWGSDRHFAWQQSSGSDARFGSLADIASGPSHVRFTSKSRHQLSRLGCPLCANSGLMHRSTTRSYSIASSASLSLSSRANSATVQPSLRLCGICALPSAMGSTRRFIHGPSRRPAEAWLKARRSLSRAN